MENVYAESDFWVAVAAASSALIVAISIFAKSLVSLIEDDADRGLGNKKLRNSAKIFSIFLILVSLSDFGVLLASIYSLKNYSSTILSTSTAASLLGATFFAFVVIVLVSGLIEIWKPINNSPDKRERENI